jgi:preprotein translocase subunit SecD
MDRNLKWRSIGLVGLIVFCLCTLAPTFAPASSLPSWFTHFFSKKINLGLDLQGGLHLTYSIDLDRAVDDKSSDIKRDLDTRFEKDAALHGKVKIATPGVPVGLVAVHLDDASKMADVESQALADYKGTVEKVTCPANEEKPDEAKKGGGVFCIQVTTAFAEDQRKSALHNAVNTIRERIDERGIAEPSVVEKNDEIIVELPGLDEDQIARVQELIARTAKLEFKLVIDDVDGKQGVQEAAWMDQLGSFVRTDDEAKKQDIESAVDPWTPEDSTTRHQLTFLTAKDRNEQILVCEAKDFGCFSKNIEVSANGKVQCKVTGKHVIERYMVGVHACGKGKDGKWLIPGLLDRPGPLVALTHDNKPEPFDPKIPEGRQLGYENVTPERGQKETEPYWRTYYLDRTVQLSGSSITRAGTTWDPNTNKPIVQVDFDRYGAGRFGDLTSQNVGAKMAIILDDRVNSAPIINGPIRGGNAVITMGGSDPDHMQAEADDLVSVLKTGSLPAPLKQESSAQVGPSLGSDAIAKAQLSFVVGVVLVVFIMLGIYKWSGWVAIGAVTINVLMMMTAMTLFGATLTLPGIAALVLTVGMGVDGNILIYERIRDELTIGKSVRGSVDVGFSRAFTAILDGHMTTAAGGWVLLQYGSGPIKGFAVMLLVGIGTTLFCSTVVTRIFFDWVVARKKGSHQTISI